jgi:hypothetical protein
MTIAAPLVLLAARAQAWDPSLYPDADPVQLWLSEEEEESVPAGYTEEALRAAIARYDALTCPPVRFEIVGTVPNAAPAHDGLSTVSVNDPGGMLGSFEIAAGIQWGTSETVEIGGETFVVADDVDLVLNDKVVFGTEEEVTAPDCDGVYSLEGIFVATLAHMLGAAGGDLAPCEPAPAEIPHDLLEGLGVRYGGGHPVVECAPAVLAIGQETTCSILPGQNAAEVVASSWTASNGASAEGGLSFVTSFDGAGTGEVEGCFQGEAECGSWEGCDPAALVVCAAPEIDVRVTVTDNRVDASALALDDVETCRPATWTWELYEDGESSPLVTVQEAEFGAAGLADGRYRLLLVGTGPGGESRIESEIDIGETDTDVADTDPPSDTDPSDTGEDRAGGGCGCASGGSAGALGALVPLLLLLRRRRTRS